MADNNLPPKIFRAYCKETQWAKIRQTKYIAKQNKNIIKSPPGSIPNHLQSFNFIDSTTITILFPPFCINYYCYAFISLHLTSKSILNIDLKFHHYYSAKVVLLQQSNYCIWISLILKVIMSNEFTDYNKNYNMNVFIIPLKHFVSNLYMKL